MANQQTPDRVTSEPVPVPPSDDVDRDRDRDRDAAEDVTDRVPGDTLDDRGTFDDPVLAGERNDPDDLTAVSPGAPEYHDPAPQNTAFGAATVGGAAAAAAQAGPSREVRDRDGIEEGAIDDRDTSVDGDRHTDHNGHDVRDDFDANRDADLDADRTAAFDQDRALEDDRTATFEEDRTAAFDEEDRAAALDADREAEERAYEDAAERGHIAADAEAGDGFHRDEQLGGPSDLPEATPATEIPTEVPAAAAVEEPIAGLWGEQTAQGYRDRWREVQLRFVDDPPAAAREANQLVEEAVGAFTAELSRQKEQLGDWSGEDTEDLRAVVRRHRDFLDRLLGL